MRPVVIGNVTDPDHDPVTLTVTAICQDEAPDINHPTHGVDALGVGTPDAAVRAEFSAAPGQPSNGRVYHIFFDADDGKGGMCAGEVKVNVPVSPNRPAIDGGALYDSTTGGACVVPEKGR